jgi:hypothetical protein
MLHGQDHRPKAGFSAFPGKIEGRLIKDQLEIIPGLFGSKLCRLRQGLDVFPQKFIYTVAMLLLALQKLDIRCDSRSGLDDTKNQTDDDRQNHESQ